MVFIPLWGPNVLIIIVVLENISGELLLVLEWYTRKRIVPTNIALPVGVWERQWWWMLWKVARTVLSSRFSMRGGELGFYAVSIFWIQLADLGTARSLISSVEGASWCQLFFYSSISSAFCFITKPCLKANPLNSCSNNTCIDRRKSSQPERMIMLLIIRTLQRFQPRLCPLLLYHAIDYNRQEFTRIRNTLITIIM